METQSPHRPLKGTNVVAVERGRTGRGRVIDPSLFDTLGEWMGYAMYSTAYGGAPPVRTGAAHATIAPYGPFRTRDGFLLLAVNHRAWRRFCERWKQTGVV